MGRAPGEPAIDAAVSSRAPNAAAGALLPSTMAATTMLARSATNPAGITYLRRARTVPGMSVSCEPALAMLVSDTGEMESPKVDPARIAPINIAGGAPSAPPAG